MAVFKKDNDWYIDYYVNGRRKREKIGPNKKLALTVLQKRKVQIAENRYLDKKKISKVLFQEFAKDYLKDYATKMRSYRSIRLTVNGLIRHFGDCCLHEITLLMIEKFQTKRLEQVKPATVNRDIARIKHIYTKAIEWGKATDNPAKKVKLLRENNRRLRFLYKDEFDRLVDCAADYFKPILILAGHTGMRRGEILSLTWDQIDFKNCVIYLTDTKNGESREILMNKTVVKALKSMPQHLKSPYVFHNTKGKPIRDIRKPFMRACEDAEIEDFRFHDLRHTFASHLVMSGHDLYTVKELLGHKDITMTMRYSHLSPTHKRKAVESLDSDIDTNMDTKTISEKSHPSKIFISNHMPA